MKSSNVCKFTTPNFSNDLSTFCFVLETDPAVMQTKTVLAHHRMILIEQGEGEFLLGDAPHAFSTGTLLFGFEGEPFSLLSGEDVRYLYIDFGGARATALCHRFGIYPHTRGRKNANGLIPFCHDCLLSTRQENIDMAAECVLLYVFSRISVDSIAQNNTLQRIIEHTEEHFQDPELSIAAIAAEIGYNPKYLSHFFKDKMKVGYSEYLRSYRLKYAVSLFELGISSVKNVAFLSGFSDPLYFSNTFKKSLGISPKEFVLKVENEKKQIIE